MKVNQFHQKKNKEIMAEHKILQGILALIDIVNLTPQATKLGEKNTARYTDYFQEKVRTIAESHNFQVVKSMGDAVLLFGTDVESTLEIILDFFDREKLEDRYGFVSRFRMVAHSGFFQFRMGNGQPLDLVDTDGIKIFRLGKHAKSWELVVTQSLYQGFKSLLTLKSIEASRLGLNESLIGFDNEEWPPPFYKLRIGKEKKGVSNLLRKRTIKLEQEVQSIPVFGNIYPPVPMEKNFINLSMISDHEQTLYTGNERLADRSWLSYKYDRNLKKQLLLKEINVSTLYKKYHSGVVLGLPGAGKTTILRYLAYKEFKANQKKKENKKQLLLFLLCQDISLYETWYRNRHGTDPGEPEPDEVLEFMTWVFLFGKASPNDLTYDQQLEFQYACKEVQEAFKGNRLTLLVDGLDEAAGSNTRERIKQLFIILYKQLSKNRIYLTTRPSESIHLEQDLEHYKVPVFKVLPLTQEQVRAVARHIIKEDSGIYKKFDQAIWQEEVVVKMALTPIIALLLTAYFQVYEKFDHRFPMYDLLVKFILLKVWDNIKNELFPYKNLKLFFHEIKKPDFPDKHRETQVFYDALASLCFHLFYDRKNGRVLWSVDAETLRIYLTRFIQDHMYYDEETAKVEESHWRSRFQRDHILIQSGANEYVFVHSTVMEYLAAVYLVQQGMNQKDKLPPMVKRCINHEANLELDTVPIAVGSDLLTGFHILRILRDLETTYSREKLYKHAFKCLAELEWLIEKTFISIRIESIKDPVLKIVGENRDAVEWIYIYLKETILSEDRNRFKRAIKGANNFLKLSRATLLEEYIDYDNFKSGDQEIVELRKELLLKLVQKSLVEEWETKHIKSREDFNNVLQLDYSGYYPEDKNFSYFKKIIGKELAGFFGSPNLVHNSSILDCVFSPDGKNFLSSDKDGTLKLWDAGSGKEVRTFPGHNKPARGCAFSPDGTRILSAYEDRILKMWDVDSGKEIRSFSGHKGSVNHCAFSPDGKQILSASGDHTLKLWDAGSGKEIRSFSGHKGPVNNCAFSPDGTKIISASYDHTLKLWDVGSGKETRTFSGHKGSVMGCAFSPDGTQIISTSHDNTLKLWEVGSAREISTFPGHEGPVSGCAFSPDGTRILSASHDNTLKLWEVESGKELNNFPGHRDYVNSCAFSPDGTKILSASEDNTLKFWDAVKGKEVFVFSRHINDVDSCAFSPDGAFLISSSRDATLKLWDAVSGKEIRTLSGHKGPVKSCAFSPDGTRILSASEDKTLKLWEFASGKEIRTFPGHKGSIIGCAFSPDGSHILSASSDKTLKLWEIESGKEIRTFFGYREKENPFGHKRDVNSCVFSLDGTLLISTSDDQKLKLWDVESGKGILTFSGHKAPVNNCVLSPDGTCIVSASNDNTLKLWEMKSGKEMRTYSGHKNFVSCCAFSMDGTRIISTSYDKTLKLWDYASGKLIISIQLPWTPYYVTISPQNPTQAVTANQNGTLTLFDLSKYM
jgi:WD40 repeat protein/GTPase SAR1 family protein